MNHVVHRVLWLGYKEDIGWYLVKTVPLFLV
jgi:hypothetical protein